ncbi:GNAT family N-acetyltransferase [Nocardioides eburneiflavus]|uniref:GNAT family N-acetyltransferase n=1 Tax=Nocardioides eburneiflavus TaxID=2518372 RepID=A0A4Z1C9V4_9ACTN|nr:GNAT family N-acetyltransferase [Nocardioides eburneiflavus]TGN64136.1 GNAT family N-acetyltransferase [Nocardioides eburneiflavus]
MATVTPDSRVDVTLRPSTDADREFLVGLYGSTREEELAQVPWAPGQLEAFVRMQFTAQDTEYRRHNPHGSFDVVEVGGHPVGRLIVDRRPGDIRVVDVSLVPHARGAGIGTRLLGDLIEEARATGRIVSIHVEAHNRAAELYARLGLAVVADLGVYRRMEWTG